ncbi:MAG: hypothetical protein ACRD0P_34760 [Stackebrandtia sp.]
MGIVADHLDSLTVRVTSPDNQITAQLANRTQVAFEFRPDCYRGYAETGLERQLAKTCRLLWVGYTRGYATVMESVGLTFKTKPSQAKTPAERRFLTERTQLIAIGATTRRLVRLRTVGLIDWEVRIVDGTVARLTEAEFLAELHEAGQALMHEFNKKMVFLKDDCYDMGLARQLRAKGIEPPVW